MLKTGRSRGLLAGLFIAAALAWGVLVMAPAEQAFVCDGAVRGQLCFQAWYTPAVVMRRFAAAHGDPAAIAALNKDFVFLTLYSLGFALANWAAGTGRPRRLIPLLGIGAALGAGAVDVVEDVLHLSMVRGGPDGPTVALAGAITMIKWSLLLASVVILVYQLVRRPQRH